MLDPVLHEGEIYHLNLTDHTGISANTMKNPHFVAVIMNPRKLENVKHKTIICVPMMSARQNLMDMRHNRPKIHSNHLTTPTRYPDLNYDTIIKCEQIYTINREYFIDYKFTLEKSDLGEIRKRMFNIIGH